MACFWVNSAETQVNIPEAEEINGVIYYKINVKIAEITWTVNHRYSEFYDLHNQLIIDHGVSKDILPPKKVIRSKNPLFIEERRKGLEMYIKSVLNYLKRTMPRVFVQFLDFHQYDIFFILHSLATTFFKEADAILSSSKSYKLTPLQLHAISECFKKPFPAVEGDDKRSDLTHVLDLCSQLLYLMVQGQTTRYFTSNVVPNELPFEFSSFKALKVLVVENLDLRNVYSVETLRASLEKLVVNGSGVERISQILQCDDIHKLKLSSSQVWKKVTELDLSDNNVTEIDESINLVPNLKTLVLNNNKISNVNNLSSLTNLVSLQVSNNYLTVCEHLHTKLGNILLLDLSRNSITSLKGFSKLYSLETLDLNCNRLTDIDEIAHIGDLPCLEYLVLTGNPVATVVDYRIKVLQNFGERAKEICLDNERPTQPELDKVSILRALRIVKEGKTPDFNNSFG